MSKPRLFICTPCYGGVEADYVTSRDRLNAALLTRGMPAHFHTVRGDSLITRVRNRAVHAFLKTDCTHLLWIDADLRFRAEDVFAMLDADLDVVGGAYPLKQYDNDRIAYAAAMGSPNILRDAAQLVMSDVGDGARTAKGGFLEVLDVATGFSLVKREVFEKMAAKMPELLVIDDARGPTRDEPYFAYYDCMIEPVTRRYLSEDYAFCRRWQQIGGKCHVYLLAELGHVGKHLFEGSAENEYELELREEDTP